MGQIIDRCDFRDEHDVTTDTPTGKRCEAAATHLIEWNDGWRFSLGCDAHLQIDNGATVKPLAITPLQRRFFVCENDGISYSFVALDVAHCRAILAKHGCVFYTEDGGETYDIERAAMEWIELAPEQAALRMTFDEDAEDPALRRLPLSQRSIGDWFCSEY